MKKKNISKLSPLTAHISANTCSIQRAKTVLESLKYLGFIFIIRFWKSITLNIDFWRAIWDLAALWFVVNLKFLRGVITCHSEVWISTEFQTCIRSEFGVRIHTLRDIMFESVVFERDIRQGMNRSFVRKIKSNFLFFPERTIKNVLKSKISDF